MIIEIHEGDRRWSDAEIAMLELPPTPTVQRLADALHAEGYHVSRAVFVEGELIAHVQLGKEPRGL